MRSTLFLEHKEGHHVVVQLRHIAWVEPADNGRKGSILHLMNGDALDLLEDIGVVQETIEAGQESTVGFAWKPKKRQRAVRRMPTGRPPCGTPSAHATGQCLCSSQPIAASKAL